MNDEKYLDKIRGCLIGGAAGDALGLPVKYLSAEKILQRYGQDGITSYDLTNNKRARISANTQMTLFTATGLLLGTTRWMMRSVGAAPWHYAGLAYKTWFNMQIGAPTRDEYGYGYSWLADVPEMGRSRFPEHICMSVIGSGKYGSIEKPINKSKGYGGLVRVAPVGLYCNRLARGNEDISKTFEIAAKVAVLTHGHRLSWLSAAVFAHIINRVTYADMTVLKAVKDAEEFLKNFYGNRRHILELLAVMDASISLAEKDSTDLENIERLGEGWTATEALAIALYCSIKYQDDFSKAIAAAANHDGNSDATASLTGNILGALHGYEKIPPQWKQKLECAEIILELADDLHHDCRATEYEFDRVRDKDWLQKYLENRRVPKLRIVPKHE